MGGTAFAVPPFLVQFLIIFYIFPHGLDFAGVVFYNIRYESYMNKEWYIL